MSVKGNKYGLHRVISPKGVLTQAADVIDNDFSTVYSNEILVEVTSLNVDSASFTQLKEVAGGDPDKIAQQILDIVGKRGKMQNPVTGSGGMFIGKVLEVGEDLKDRDLKPGDKIASLVSLSLTPLKIDEILAVHTGIDRVDVKGKAILFESGIYAKLPDDLSETLALAALDVAGAPAQVKKLVKKNDRVLIVGGGGKSGMLCCYEAKKQAGPDGLVVATEISEAAAKNLETLGLCDKSLVVDATNPAETLEKVLAASGGKEYDICINCVNVQNAEMSCILPVRDDGITYFFSMATSFTKAALGAEGVGKDVNMIIGNGYTKGHADTTLDILRESDVIRKEFEERYS